MSCVHWWDRGGDCPWCELAQRKAELQRSLIEAFTPITEAIADAIKTTTDQEADK